MSPYFRLLTLLLVFFRAAAPAARSDDHPRSDLPGIFLIGDSTVKNRTRGQKGWGECLAAQVDPTKATVENHALGGRSSRSFLREGLWDAVLERLRPGDVVLIQFGHNDGGPLDEGRARASLKGIGEEEREVTIKETGEKETIRSYGWYLRRYISDAKGKGALPVVCSLVPRNIWKDGKVTRDRQSYAGWAAEVARTTEVPFLDLNEILAARYEIVGEAETNRRFFTEADHTHTSPEGAEFSASVVADLLRVVPGARWSGWLSKKARKIVALTFDDGCLSHRTHVADLLKEYGFGATFFVCEFPGMFGNPEHAMTWEQMGELHAMGFEIANHTLTHRHASSMKPEEFEAELSALDARCEAHGIPKPVTFAWPAYVETVAGRKVLADHGIVLARGGGGEHYHLATDDRFNIPSVSTSGEDERATRRVLEAIDAPIDKDTVLVLTFHGVPDTGHPHVNTPPEFFERYLDALKAADCEVVALKDLLPLVEAAK
jgi:rhamnogalacturonan acetylesterase